MKKMLLFLLGLVVVLSGGTFFMLRANSDKILDALCAKIEQSTGYPLRMEAMPKISLFPPTLEMGSTEWGQRDGDIFVSFRKARAGVVASSLLSGSPDVSSVEFEDLYVQVRQAEKKPETSEKRGENPSGDSGGSAGARAPNTVAPSESAADKTLAALREKMPAGILLRNATLHFVNSKGQSVELTELHTEIQSKNGVSLIPSLSCLFLNSKVTGKARLDLSASPLVDAEISAPGLDLGLLARMLAGRDLVEGKGDLSATLRFLALDVLPTLTGKGQLSSAGLDLKASALPANLSGMANVNPFRLDDAIFQWTMDQGVASLSHGEAHGPGFTLNSTGKIDLPARQLDMEGTLDIRSVALLPVSLSGSFHNPRYSVRQDQALDAAVQTLEKHGVDVDEAIDKGLNRLLRNLR